MRTTTPGIRLRTAVIALAVVVGVAGSIVFLSPGSAIAASKCASLTKSVHLFVDAKRGVNVLTYNTKRFAGLKKSGYADKGVLFKAGSKMKGLVKVRVLYNKKNRDRIYTTSKSEIKKLKKKGYKDNGTGFYAYSKSGSCLTPVYRFHKGKLHRFVVTAADQAALKKQGWSAEKKVFWIAKAPVKVQPPTSTPTKPPATTPPATDASFMIAVLPDTQREVHEVTPPDTRFADRTTWLADNAKKLKLEFVTHTGDIVDWDTPTHGQYVNARHALSILSDNKIPYSLTPGNHDTAAVCPGGGACPGANTRATVRDTTMFNRYLNGGVTDIGGRYEAAKLDNTYSTFTAGERKWLVLNLELWPRTGVVTWAQQVVSSHPDYNVIVATHSYLAHVNGQWVIYNKSDYGATSPQYLFDHLISKYPNIKMVLCGHTGSQGHRVDTGVNGNRIDTFLLTMHSQTTNPLRLIQIDPVAGTLKTWVYAPANDQSWPSWTISLKGLSFVK
jgi:hypothetical protein